MNPNENFGRSLKNQIYPRESSNIKNLKVACKKEWVKDVKESELLAKMRLANNCKLGLRN